MKKNEMGKVLKVVGIVVMALGIVCSFVLGFNSGQTNPMDEIMGYVIEPTVTYNFSQAIFGVFASVVAGLVLMGLAEIIYILDEKRENVRRLCGRFGIQPAIMENHGQGRRGMVQGNGMQNMQNMHNGQNFQNGQAAGNVGGNHMAGGQNGGHNMASSQNAPQEMNAQSMNPQAAQQAPKAEEQFENVVHEDYGDE